ncbi:hypothetical protein BU52_19325 [Streptomyces toyocaensis]|uniref:Uncharacterized protein n=1 Tax=Streptomyces toyocaensis TaxID=55952 RepID=A0A081XQ50_STRTO|nr:hypothetical protein [Streptomyces toyocaensis]KES05673.1 hypothetical protein BU52_19325 [Streptomyces toyocaensis]
MAVRARPAGRSRDLALIGTGLYRTARILLVLPALAVWRRVLAPAGRALGTLLRWIFVEPVRWVYRSVLVPAGYVVRDAVLRPAVEAARASVRQTRADVRGTLFGAPLKPQVAHRREPPGAEARTLGSSTTALTKD